VGKDFTAAGQPLEDVFLEQLHPKLREVFAAWSDKSLGKLAAF